MYTKFKWCVVVCSRSVVKLVASAYPGLRVFFSSYRSQPAQDEKTNIGTYFAYNWTKTYLSIYSSIFYENFLKGKNFLNKQWRSLLKDDFGPKMLTLKNMKNLQDVWFNTLWVLFYVFYSDFKKTCELLFSKLFLSLIIRIKGVKEEFLQEWCFLVGEGKPVTITHFYRLSRYT